MNERRANNGRRREVEPPDAALNVWRAFDDPVLRWCDVAGASVLAGAMMLHPQDPDLLDVFNPVVQDQMRKAVMSGDPFHANYPAREMLSLFTPGRLPIVQLPSGEVLSITPLDVCRNICLAGPTGSGKSSWIRLFIAAWLQAAKMEADQC